MPGKRKLKDDRLARFLAKEALVAARPKRTLGGVMSLYREAAARSREAGSAFTEVIDRVYRGCDGPPDTGAWTAYPRYRLLYTTLKSGSIRMYSFGWSHETNHIGGGHWVRSWSSRIYSGLTDADCVRDVIGRRPTSPLEELTSEMEVSDALADNDPALVAEFERCQLRAEGLASRVRVIWGKVTETVTGHLAETENWRRRAGEPWRRITLEDGTVLTITGEGKVVPADAPVEVAMSVHHPVVVRPSSFPNSLEERVRLAQEKRCKTAG
jgi:hypothetical protein